ARRFEIRSVGNTLAMPLAAGWNRKLDGRIVAGSLGTPIDPAAVFNELWNAAPAELMPRWSAIRAKIGSNIVGQQTLLFFVREQVLSRAADDFAAHGQKAAQLLTALDDPLCIRPTEVHFLIMLARD